MFNANRTMRIVFAVVIIFLSTARVDAAFLTARELLHHCNAKLGDRSANFNTCLQYISAIHDIMQDARSIRGKAACFDRNLMVGDLVNPVLKYIDRLPEPKKFGAGGVVLLALAAAYPCPKMRGRNRSAAAAVDMNFLRPNMKAHVGTIFSTSGFIQCIATIEACTVEPKPFSSGLRPYLYFDTSALSPNLKAVFYEKCRQHCFFSGVVSVSYRFGKTKLKPRQVTFQTTLAALQRTRMKSGH